jgi:hypothetical protein
MSICDLTIATERQRDGEGGVQLRQARRMASAQGNATVVVDETADIAEAAMHR